VELFKAQAFTEATWRVYKKSLAMSEKNQLFYKKKLKSEVRYIHTYHSLLISEGVAELSQIFFRDTHVLPKLVSYEEHCRMTGGKPIAILLQSMSGVSAIDPLAAFYDIHGGRREVLFFYFVTDTTRD
jgi:hypothetical protein